MATIEEYPELNGGEGGGSPPSPPSGDWGGIAALAAGRTDYRSVNFAGVVDSGVVSYDGTYTVLSVDSNSITLSNPALVNPNWDNVVTATQYASASLSTSGERWIGPFTGDIDGLDRVLSNFVALGGLYSIDKKGKQRPVSVSVLVELTPVDSEDTATGPPETFAVTLTGDDKEKSSIGVSLMAQPTFTGRCSVRARRTSPTNPDFEGTLVDEVKWRDAYAMAEVTQTDFGNVTTVQTRTYATSGATSVKERKLNLNATRLVAERLGDGSFGALHATERVDDIIAAICRDPYIGNYPDDQIDFDNIYDTVAEVQAYFGSIYSVVFGYTFDDESTSFEETLATVADCIFCSAYRQGSLLRISFERARDGGVLLFNHRNVLPASQERSRTFGPVDDHDGVELNWVSPKDGAQLTYHIPYDRSALKPRKVEVAGVRRPELAYWHAWRAQNKINFQNTTLEQETTQEAALVLPSDRVLITDLTRPPGFEGDVLDADGRDLELSQPTTFEPGVSHVIFITHIDATIEALPVSPWVPGPGEEPDAYRVTLDTAPRLPLAVGEGLSARPTYEIVPGTDARSRAFLITEREPNSNFTETVRAINYSPMYYANDELVLWLPFEEQSLRDQSPYVRDGDQTGPGGYVFDDDRDKYVYAAAGPGSSVTFEAFDAPESYTKAAWVKASAGDLLSSPNEVFGMTGDGRVAGGHNATFHVAADVPDDEWHHVALTYDVDAALMELYVDGRLRSSASPMPERVLGQEDALVDVNGRVDDLRLWKRAFSPVEVLSLYRSTQRPIP